MARALPLLVALLPLAACGTDDWCRRFNLDCV